MQLVIETLVPNLWPITIFYLASKLAVISVLSLQVFLKKHQELLSVLVALTNSWAATFFVS
jgi:hypothetical protein